MASYRFEKIENPITQNFIGYQEPLMYGTNKDGCATHEILVSYPLYKLAAMKTDGFRWDDNFWAEIQGTTEKALLICVVNRLYWVPKSMVYKIRKIREVTEVIK